MLGMSLFLGQGNKINSSLINREVLAADKTLTTLSPNFQFLDAGGADRIVNLPVDIVKGNDFIFKNIGSANKISIKLNGTLVFALSPGQAGEVIYDGTAIQSI